jgi:hypothetical protein
LQYCENCRQEHFNWVPKASIHILGTCEICKRDNVPIFGLHSELAIRRYHNYAGGNRKAIFELDEKWHNIGEKFRKRIRTKRSRIK